MSDNDQEVVTNEVKLRYIKDNVDAFPDFPKPGILFRDIFSLTRNPKAFNYLNDLILHHISTSSKIPDIIVALDSRGFLIGPQISLHFDIPLIPIRKKGLIPGKTRSVKYELEYGIDEIEMQVSDMEIGKSAIIVDDLLATGGSMAAACKLAKEAGLEIQECLVVMELTQLNGRAKVNAPVYSIIQY